MVATKASNGANGSAPAEATIAGPDESNQAIAELTRSSISSSNPSARAVGTAKGVDPNATNSPTALVVLTTRLTRRRRSDMPTSR